jgi:hypothetical protein
MSSVEGLAGRPPAAARIGRRLWELGQRIPIPLVIVLLIALGLRVALWRIYHPVIMQPDAVTYISMATYDMFSDPARPAGYAMVLDALHAVSDNVDFTVWLQHLIGIGTGLLLYATVIRAGAPRWVAIVAAASVLLSVDQVVLEHALIPEALFTLMFVGVLYASVRALDDPSRTRLGFTNRDLCLVAAGVLLGLSVWSRAVAAPLIPALALWFGIVLPGRWWQRLGRGAVAGGVAAAAMLLYFQLNLATTGHFVLTRAPGWAIYARTAPFADCTKFEPPAGTKRLCQEEPPEQRLGPDAYAWQEDYSPAYRVFGPPPAGNDKLAAFGRAALIHQPLDYLDVVSSDVLLYFGVGVDPQAHLGALQIEWAPGDRIRVMNWINEYYAPEKFGRAGGVETFEDLQSVLRVHPLAFLFATALGGIGMVLARGRMRAALALLLGASLLLIVVPPATATYNYRYAIPAAGPLFTAGVIGLWLALSRIVAHRNQGRSERSDRPQAAS